MDKKTLRKQIYDNRCILSKEYVITNSKRIFKNLISGNILTYNNILVYSDFKNEVQTGDIINYLFENCKNVFLPVCNIENYTFTVHQIFNADYDSQLNLYGIKEPKYSAVPNDKIDCAIIPGIAFDKKGNRIGFGKGYYDKFLCENKTVCKIALCYEFQLVESIPAHSYDIPMDFIITENRVIKTR